MKVIASLRANLFEHEDFSLPHLVYFRLFELFVVVNTLHLMWSWGFYILKIADVVLPLGLANHIDISFMHGNNLALWNAAAFSLITILAFFRIGGNWMYALAFILIEFQYAARYSIGEIPHSSNLAGLSLLAFAVGFIAFKDAKSRFSFIMGTILFFTGLGYVTAAFSKLIATGITWVDGHHLRLWIAEKGTDILSREGEFTLSFIQVMAQKSLLMATLFLIFGLVAEFFGFLIWFKKTRILTTTAIIGMHIGVTYSMNIRFDSFIMILVLIGYPWPYILSKIKITLSSKYADKFTKFLDSGFNLN